MEQERFERLRWRCIRRGLLELDIILSRFLAEDFDRLSVVQQEVFVDLADMEDHQLWGMIHGSAPCNDAMQNEILGLLRKHAKK